MLGGVTSTTKTNLQLGAGIITTTYTKGGTINKENIISATRGGGSFTAVPTLRQIEADGLPQNVKGMEVIDDYVVTLNTTLIEFTTDTLKMALPGAYLDTDNSIKCKHEIADAEYKDIYWVGDLADGTNIAIKIKNALNNGGLNITISNKGEGTFALSLIGHYSLDKLNEPPFEIIR